MRRSSGAGCTAATTLCASCGSSGGTTEHCSHDRRAKTQGLPARRIISLGWTPQRIEVFAGGLSWKEQYGLLAPIFKRTWRRVLGTRIDPSQKQQVFTDWAAVDRFAQSFFELANGPRTDHTGAAGAAGAYRLR
jgi:hypothetical protein